MLKNRAEIEIIIILYIKTKTQNIEKISYLKHTIVKMNPIIL